MTPRQIVTELDRYIVGQTDAKKAVAIAVRNRGRRRLIPDSIREEIYPRNIIMIGPTGCGKTEIARRLSRLTGAPFVKVEATKYTEVGYVGRDVESMVRDLVSASLNLVRREYRATVEDEARRNAEERILDLLIPSTKEHEIRSPGPGDAETFMKNLTGMSPAGLQALAGLQQSTQPNMQQVPDDGAATEEKERSARVREQFREKLQKGELESREVELEVSSPASPMVQVLSGQNMEEIDMQVQNMLGDLMPRKQKRRRVTVEEARRILLEEELDRLIDPDRIQSEAVRRAEQMGIIFIDEIDKICGKGGSSQSGGGPDVSREGVQRDLLPIVEGATIQTRQGPIKTDHVLFIAAGAFHTTKPSDLIPELQGRFPIRVELEKLTQADFKQILVGPENSLVRQAQALMATEGVELEFTDDAVDALSGIAFHVNEESENIGARRLHTIMERLLEETSFEAPDLPPESKKIRIDRTFVENRLKGIVEDRDLSRYIL